MEGGSRYGIGLARLRGGGGVAVGDAVTRALRPITAADISDAAAHKPLGKFGSALIRRSMVREGRAAAERDDENTAARLNEEASHDQ